jgi:hypothetical protein
VEVKSPGHGEAAWTGRLAPLAVDALIYGSSMVMLETGTQSY